ncbi:hypothetical protein ISN45_Aa04g007440 [Arabidopsis thaliana x Arabidopsis arenosa]|uniref:Uncharacterized protein n=1 Tax=Arabidopsis thaliana x Arabidopsis arenosa TaxID=1240361 RepID=A0A8T2A7B4_9BRAS|nr:hypothetical protein ISN45_Aa04g007440 [Arabidopsis thaliana x Arabidopsis arenosa]
MNAQGIVDLYVEARNPLNLPSPPPLLIGVPPTPIGVPPTPIGNMPHFLHCSVCIMYQSYVDGHMEKAETSSSLNETARMLKVNEEEEVEEEERKEVITRRIVVVVQTYVWRRGTKGVIGRGC